MAALLVGHKRLAPQSLKVHALADDAAQVLATAAGQVQAQLWPDQVMRIARKRRMSCVSWAGFTTDY